MIKNESKKIETIVDLFEDKEIRSIWDNEKDDYYFSVVDVVNALANPKDARKYWSVLKKAYKGIRKESLRDNMSDI